jgi:hypothetical protein
MCSADINKLHIHKHKQSAFLQACVQYVLGSMSSGLQ